MRCVCNDRNAHGRQGRRCCTSPPPPPPPHTRNTHPSTALSSGVAADILAMLEQAEKDAEMIVIHVLQPDGTLLAHWMGATVLYPVVGAVEREAGCPVQRRGRVGVVRADSAQMEAAVSEVTLVDVPGPGRVLHRVGIPDGLHVLCDEHDQTQPAWRIIVDVLSNFSSCPAWRAGRCWVRGHLAPRSRPPLTMLALSLHPQTTLDHPRLCVRPQMQASVRRLHPCPSARGRTRSSLSALMCCAAYMHARPRACMGMVHGRGLARAYTPRPRLCEACTACGLMCQWACSLGWLTHLSTACAHSFAVTRRPALRRCCVAHVRRLSGRSDRSSSVRMICPLYFPLRFAHDTPVKQGKP
jgi:hypothetical protein